MLRMILKQTKKVTASFYSFMSAILQPRRQGFPFIVYSAKIMLLNTCCREANKNSHLTPVAWIIFSHVFPLSTRKLTLKMKPL